MTPDFDIRKIRPEDFDLVRDLPPDDWNFNYADFLKQHFHEKYFYAVVTYTAAGITGTGNAFFFGKSGWLGNIIVKSEHRKQGIGLFITGHLIRHLTKTGCETVFLLATEKGAGIYQKAGFKSVIKYRYFSSESDIPYSLPKEVRRMNHFDLEEILKLDIRVTGEDRHFLISQYYENGWVYAKDSSISGYYLPDFGRGVVIASDRKAGIEFLELKHSQKNVRSGVPVENKQAIKFFEDNKFKENPSCTRMMLGRKIDWNPQNIYSYAHGYCG
ncbi:MAG TPA: GNAT family N-acetyltransferase [Bacteroidales bacterium]|nr:GNAT family N-acetyltransferase [Bacteroidales bacterium]